MTREADWVSAHLFYHDRLDPLLADLVAPLTEELAAAGLCDGYFFLRYWDGGSHLRLRLLAPPGVHGDIRSRVAEQAGRFFRERPARRTADPSAYLGLASWLARREGVRDYSRRLCPNNSVAFIPYRREYQRYGREAAIQAVERHFVESSRIALGLLRSGLSGGQRDTAALSLILLAWLCGNVDPTRLPSLPAPGELTNLERRYDRQQETVCEIAARMRALAGGGNAAPGGALGWWGQSVTRLRAALGESASASRIIDTCAHLVCNRLGVSITGEAYLRYLAFRSLAAEAR